jgi:hypothetical protein
MVRRSVWPSVTARERETRARYSVPLISTIGRGIYFGHFRLKKLRLSGEKESTAAVARRRRFGALLAAAFYFAVAAATIVVATVGTRHRIATQGVRTAPRPARLRIDLLPLLPPKRLRA